MLRCEKIEWRPANPKGDTRHRAPWLTLPGLLGGFVLSKDGVSMTFLMRFLVTSTTFSVFMWNSFHMPRLKLIGIRSVLHRILFIMDQAPRRRRISYDVSDVRWRDLFILMSNIIIIMESN